MSNNFGVCSYVGMSGNTSAIELRLFEKLVREQCQHIEDTIRSGCSSCNKQLVVFDSLLKQWHVENSATQVFSSYGKFEGVFCDNCYNSKFNTPA